MRGEVRDATTGAALAGAEVTLASSGGKRIARTPTDAKGTFVLDAPVAGSYTVAAAARGYRTSSTVLLASDDRTKPVNIALAPEATLRELGHTVTRARAAAAADATLRISQDEIAAGGALRTSDALRSLPGVSVSGDADAPGGDAYVSLRGLRPAESQVLLDGHPIGPIGVRNASVDADGQIEGFNFQDAPYFGLRGIDVDIGPVKTGDEGSDAVGGTIDLRTFDATQRSQLSGEQTVGTQGRTATVLRATGGEGKFGYAFAGGVEGTYGAFPGASIAQTGLRGTDFTGATLAGLTYHVAGDYLLRNQVAKIAYAPMPSTRLTFTAYGATSWADKTGEGDNDFNPAAYVLANAPIGASPQCPHGVLVSENAGPACLSPDRYASLASGPAGGGPGAWQALRNQDYDARATSAIGRADLLLDVYTDAYAVLYHRDASPVNGPLDDFLDVWSTQGVRLSDSVSSGRSAFAFGASWLRQTLSGDGTVAGTSEFVAHAPATRLDRSAFLKDDVTLGSRFSLVGGAWLQASSVDPVVHLDPQGSLEYRPESNDALRLSAGATSDEPSLQDGRVTLLPVGALNPNCGALARATTSAPEPVNVGSAPSTNLSAETGSDLEFGYEHRFDAADALTLTLYDANVANRIVSGAFAAGSDLPAAAVPALLARIDGFCGVQPAPGAVTFTLDRTFNAAGARLHGIELAGRTRVSTGVAVHYAYDVQSIVLNGLPDDVLRTDPTLVDGLQVFEVPLHKATLGLELTTRGGLAFRLDGNAVGPNNPQQLPGYAYADASLEAPVSRRLALRLEGTNVFNSHAQTYGLVGYGLPYATNAYGATAPFLQTYNERYGLAPATFALTAKIKI